MLTVLVVGRQADIMERVRALIESEGYQHIGALTDDEALALMATAKPDALLLGGGVEATSRTLLVREFALARPGRPVVEPRGAWDIPQLLRTIATYLEDVAPRD
jgi:DNA-binding response OmpR family regulator